MRLEVGDIEEDDGRVERIRIQNLMNLKDEYIQWYNKAISFDFTHLTPIRLNMERQSNESVLYYYLFDIETWKRNEFCMAQRLVPINKVAPKLRELKM
ncbi:unnamed protein product (macronuclear) [Paramecium tetraurelia]|uniref:Uncharacterized protein n=1 Tax=Paramecium tetraurelia TaxID=5888 RepID=A0CT21_PARTE|nr:uncharacterized protein GSPATT00038956001 [Paramecium tetraurelia]CAK73938.1 unnamed protein product [Paramecium tetraurelia]|eukprot:XP_001441335.1 hypothetical protein (macronuclear) [Paramecium tetraurelia strain d4-2]